MTLKKFKKRNYNISMKHNYDLCVKLSKTLDIPKIQKSTDMAPSYIGTYYDEYNKLCIEYDKKAIGPAKSEAFCKFIEIDFTNSHQSLLEDIDIAFKEHIDNILMDIIELNASEQKWVSIIKNLQNSIETSEENRDKLVEERNKLNEDIENLQRSINESTSDHNKKIEIRMLELNSTQQLLQTKIYEKQDNINDYKKQIEELEDNLRNNTELKLSLQGEKIKEVSTR